MATAQRTGYFHPLPVIGHPETFYAKHAKEAEASGDQHARASHKVGQYVTLGLDHHKPWEQRLAAFRHALKHYCSAPPDGDEALKSFYHKLCELVKRHCGHEAMVMARKKNDEFNIRLAAGVPREELTEEAETFFPQLLGHSHGCPDWMNEDAYRQVRHIEDRWV